MDPREWERIEALLDEVLELPAPVRPEALRTLCRGDLALEEKARRYLNACERADAGLNLPRLEALVASAVRAHTAEGRGGGENGLPASPEHDDAVARPRDQFQAGDELGNYRILDLLGRGGMGAVYLAERADGAFHRRVAIKVVKRGMDTDEILRRFHQEREILARLAHPKIARLLDGGVTPEGLPYFVMELVQGDEIDTWCDLHALDVEARIDLFLEACDAVQYAHAALVVHRDLKPGNILVEDGEVRLLDFGIAKLLEDEAPGDETGPGRRRLTLAYAAPEQIRGEPTSTAMDVYSLGVVLHELLTGELPFARRGGRKGGRTVLERAMRGEEPGIPSAVVLDDAPELEGSAVRRALHRRTTPSALRTRLRGDLDAILLRALAPDPERRYPSVEALAADLRRHRSGHPVRARPHTALYRTGSFVRRNRLLVTLGAVTALAMVGGSALAASFGVVANRERDRRQLEAERAVAARDFVVGLFAQLDPDLGGGRSTFSREELIDLGARGLEDIGEQPELRAGILNTLGQVAFNLGDRGRAEDFFRGAWALLDATPREPEAAAAMMGIGEVLRSELRFDEAERWFRESLAVRESTLPPGDPRLAETRAALALALYNQGRERYAEAEVIYQALLSPGAETPPRVRASALGGLGNLQLGEGRHAEAEASYTRALEARRVLQGGTLDPTAGRVLWGLGHARRLQENLTGAERAYRDALDVHLRVYGDRHQDVAWGHYNLATVLEAMEDHEAASRAYARAAEVLEALQDPDYLYTGFAYHGLGRVLEELGDHDAATDAFRRALAIYEVPRTGDPVATATRVAAVRLALGRLHLEAARWAAAEEELRTAYLLYRDEARSTEGVERASEALTALFMETGRPDSAAVYRTLSSNGGR
jgi:serine/threonine protein kinase/tetratricopeptide (TPR) repeat protein